MNRNDFRLPKKKNDKDKQEQLLFKIPSSEMNL